VTSSAEARDDAWRRRAAIKGAVNFTMMYIAHDAFNRDMTRLIEAASCGDGLTAPARTTWHTLCHQLHLHHSTEDAALWPPLRAAIDDPAEAAILDEMETEHAAIDPRIDQVDAAFEHGDPDALLSNLTTLGKGLSMHMIHEESEALPLLERRLGQAGWDAFGAQIRQRQGGLKGGAAYLPWVLDGAGKETTNTVLKMLPPPARVLYRTIWEPKYRKGERLR
jgi:iron-sulfur cluster repair protein YtfE (RIC family)